jgi:hypothetical protein
LWISKEVKSWFEQQAKIWPNRYNKDKTINLAFLYGCLLGYREENEKNPELSEQFADCIQYHEDNYTAKPK